MLVASQSPNSIINLGLKTWVTNYKNKPGKPVLSSWVIPWDKQSLRGPPGLHVLIPCDSVGVAVPRGEEQGWVSSCWVAPLELLRPLHLHPGFCCRPLKTILAPTALHSPSPQQLWNLDNFHFSQEKLEGQRSDLIPPDHTARKWQLHGSN